MQRLLSFLAIFASCSAAAGEKTVSTQADYEAAAGQLRAGDTIVLANGEWTDFEILLTGEGTAEKPITLRAETKGKVFITGESNLRLAGKHLVVTGLVNLGGATLQVSQIGVAH